MTKKVFIIDSCWECPHRAYRTIVRWSENALYCGYDAPDVYRLTDYTIPDWCPLPDAEVEDDTV